MSWPVHNSSTRKHRDKSNAAFDWGHWGGVTGGGVTAVDDVRQIDRRLNVWHGMIVRTVATPTNNKATYTPAHLMGVCGHDGSQSCIELRRHLQNGDSIHAEYTCRMHAKQYFPTSQPLTSPRLTFYLADRRRKTRDRPNRLAHAMASPSVGSERYRLQCIVIRDPMYGLMYKGVHHRKRR